MMTAQIANGGYAIKPKIIVDSNPVSYEDAKQSMESGLLFDTNSEELIDKKLFKDKKNIKIVQEAMFASTNERFGTSYKSRIDDPKYQFVAHGSPPLTQTVVDINGLEKLSATTKYRETDDWDTMGAKGRKDSLPFTERFNRLCISGSRGSASRLRPPKARGPNSIAP